MLIQLDSTGDNVLLNVCVHVCVCVCACVCVCVCVCVRQMEKVNISVGHFWFCGVKLGSVVSLCEPYGDICIQVLTPTIWTLLLISSYMSQHTVSDSTASVWHTTVFSIFLWGKSLCLFCQSPQSRLWRWAVSDVSSRDKKKQKRRHVLHLYLNPMM